jgi:hypothetical protein
LLDEKGSDLVDRRCPARDPSGPDATAGLQIELVLAFLLDHVQVRSQRCLGDRLGIVVVVLLPLHEGFNVDRRDMRGSCPNLDDGALLVWMRSTSRFVSKMSLKIDLFLQTFSWLFTIGLIAATLAAMFG